MDNLGQRGEASNLGTFCVGGKLQTSADRFKEHAASRVCRLFVLEMQFCVTTLVLLNPCDLFV